MSLAFPFALLLLPLPFLVHRYLKRAGAVRAALQVSASLFDTAAPAAGRGDRTGKALLVLAWIALVVAAARPQWIGEPLALPTEGRDLMMAVDVSGSMEIADMQFRSDGAALDRLTAVKLVGGDFLERRVDGLDELALGH